MCIRDRAYVHRIGRTGRAGKTGIAVTLVDWDELPRWTMIDKALGLENPDPLETYSSSAHLYEEMKIPAEATGSIGRGPRSPESKDRPRRESRDGETRESSSDRPARNRDRDRTRQRTRGATKSTTESVETTEAGQTTSASGDTDTAAAGDSTGPAKRRRRRRRPSTSAPTAAS